MPAAAVNGSSPSTTSINDRLIQRIAFTTLSPPGSAAAEMRLVMLAAEACGATADAALPGDQRGIHIGRAVDHDRALERHVVQPDALVVRAAWRRDPIRALVDDAEAEVQAA